ncbi:MAG: T9SS type A sorting domain-containing protein [Bacteroidia bacterium]|nr:T9SS type A sorting domain-containing protein [Bacteroidia bacterium]
MKKIIFVAFTLYSVVAYSNKVTITNSGFAFSPDSISINLGDTIVFQLGGTHNAVEVNQTTWNSNGTTALSGGFNTPFTGGQITGLTPGYHYYVCTNHAFMGMKGKIFVVSNSNINNLVYKNKTIDVFPNPTSGILKLQTNFELSNPNNRFSIYNISGEKINSSKVLSNEIDMSGFPKGIYFIEIIADKRTYVKKITLE